MKKTEREKKPNTVQVVRKHTGLSQPQFAKLVGISPATVASIETGRLKVSAELADRISIATGVVPSSVLDDAPAPLYLGTFEPYTADSYKHWKQETHTAVKGADKSQQIDEELAEKACVQLAVLQEAARRKNRLFAVQYRLQQWFEMMLKDYDLSGECKKIYRERNDGPFYALPLFVKHPSSNAGMAKVGTKTIFQMGAKEVFMRAKPRQK